LRLGAFASKKKKEPRDKKPAAAGISTWYIVLGTSPARRGGYSYNDSTLHSTALFLLQVRMVFRRGFSCQLFEIEVEGIATHKQGLLGQGIDGMRRQVPLSDQRNGVIDP
jgi:hypothetical protein